MNSNMRIYSLFCEIIQFFFFPVLKWQGNQLRKDVLKLPEAIGPRSGRLGDGQKLNILIIGDSSACGVGVKSINKSLAGYLIKELSENYDCTWKIIAKSGLTTSDLIKLIKEQNDSLFDSIVISIGMNDITSGISRERWLKQLEKLQILLQKKFSTKRLIFCGVPPIEKFKIIPNPLKQILALKAHLFNMSLSKFCNKDREKTYLSINLPFGEEMLAADGFHPSEDFYKLWARIIHDVIINDK